MRIEAKRRMDRERTGADVNDVARGMGLDNRIGGKFLHAGPGFGGSCFPKDATALLKTAHDHGVPLRIVETVAAVNDQRKRAMARKVVTALDGSIRGKTIAVLGLSFKPNTDDMRNSPSIPLITALHDLGAIVRGYDPAAMEAAKAQLPDVIYCGNAYEAAEGVGRPTAERHVESPLPRRRKASAKSAAFLSGVPSRPLIGLRPGGPRVGRTGALTLIWVPRRHRSAISLMKVILVARKALAAYLISSAARRNFSRTCCSTPSSLSPSVPISENVFGLVQSPCPR